MHLSYAAVEWNAVMCCRVKWPLLCCVGEPCSAGWSAAAGKQLSEPARGQRRRHGRELSMLHIPTSCYHSMSRFLADKLISAVSEAISTFNFFINK